MDRKWNKDELPKIRAMDIKKWDTTLCAKWLLDFQWEPVESNLTPAEVDAVKTLRRVRNYAKHNALSHQVTSDMFKERCSECRESLKALGIQKSIIEKIIFDANNACVVGKDQLETPWDYVTKDVLGTGAFGVVICGENNIDHSKSAIKLIPIADADFDKNVNHNAFRETRTLHKLNTFHHINVAKYISSARFKFTPERFQKIIMWTSDVYDLKKLQKSDLLKYIILEAIQKDNMVTGLYITTAVYGETLRVWLKSDHLPETDDNEQVQICQGLVAGLSYIHSQGVIHRDLRPENVFFNIGLQLPIKIGDFGLSTHQFEIATSITRTSQVGHHLYQAPEMKTDPGKNQTRYSKAVDLFSLGLTISEVFDPEPNTNIVDEKFNIIKYKRETGKKIENNWPHVHYLILRLTEINSSTRGSLDEQGTVEWWFQNHSHYLTTGAVSADSVNEVHHNLEGLTLSQTGIPIPGPSSSPDLADAEGSQIMSLAEADILRLRKYLLHEIGFWSAENITKFLQLIEPDRTHIIGTDSEKKYFSSNVYRIQKNRPNLLNKNKLKAAVVQLGFPNLAGTALSAIMLMNEPVFIVLFR